MSDNASPLLPAPREKARHVGNRNQGYVESITEADEARRLVRSVNIEAAGEVVGLAGDNADHVPVHPGEAGDDIRRVKSRWLQELTAVHKSIVDIM